MLRRAKQTKRQIIESLNRRVLKEEDNEYQTFSLKLRPWVTATPDELEHILAAALNIHSSEVARKHNIESDVIVEPMKVQGPYEFSMNETTLSKRFQDKGMGKTPLGVELKEDGFDKVVSWLEKKDESGDTEKGLKKMLYTLEKGMNEEELAQHIKNLQSHLQELVYIQKNQYGPNLGDKEEEWIPNESEQKNIDLFDEPERWENLKIVTDKFGNSVKTRTIEDGSRLFEYPDGSWGFNDPREDEEDDINFRQTGRDINEVGLPTVRREDSDRLRRKPYSAQARFRAGLGKTL